MTTRLIGFCSVYKNQMLVRAAGAWAEFASSHPQTNVLTAQALKFHTTRTEHVRTRMHHHPSQHARALMPLTWALRRACAPGEQRRQRGRALCRRRHRPGAGPAATAGQCSALPAHVAGCSRQRSQAVHMVIFVRDLQQLGSVQRYLLIWYCVWESR
jgi:hypothetical protein